MMNHTMRTSAVLNSRASATRRVARRITPNRLYCGTNGCTSFLDVDETNRVATCHICGYRRQLQ
jgi:hypothetical protein